VGPAHRADGAGDGELRDLLKIEKEIARQIDLIVGTSSSEVAKAYERRVGELERQKLLIDEKRGEMAKKPASFDELFELAVNFLGKPYELWVLGIGAAETGAPADFRGASGLLPEWRLSNPKNDHAVQSLRDLSRRKKPNGAPDTIRTCGLRLRRATLYPAELRVLTAYAVLTQIARLS
jgi:hypothetical protein